MLNLILAFVAGGIVVFLGMGVACRRLARKKASQRDIQDWEARQEPSHHWSDDELRIKLKEVPDAIRTDQS